MAVLERTAIIIVGIVSLVFNITLRIFITVCAVFATAVMVGLMIEWTKALFNKKADIMRAA